jgi:cytochrome c biogenesis protein
LSVKERNFVTALWDFFCSLKLTIITLILLAITSIIGTVIQQNLSPQEYLREYSETTFRVLSSLQFFDMYHSWWFLALLGVFTINLICCSIKRFPRVLKTVRNPVLVPEDTLYRTMSNLEEHVVSGTLEDTRRKMETFLGKNFAAPVVTEKDGKIHFFAQKGTYARFGVYVTHLAIIIIFTGAIVGNLLGFKAFVNIVEGTETSQVWPRGGNQPLDLGFSVRCDSFNVTFYPGTGRPKEFKSVLSVVDGGKPVPGLVNRPVIVNDPMTYKGITFYQSSYGPAGDPSLTLKVRVRATGETFDISAPQGQTVALPGGASVRVVDFTDSFQNFGPAARLEIRPKSGQPGSFVVLQKFPEFDAQRGGDYIFSLIDFKQKFYTGLQVAKDPGVWVVWLGCTMLVLGSLCAFFLSHRRVWVTIQQVGNKTGIKVGGTAHRNQAAFEMFFEEFKKKLKNELTA